jgi:DNA polymerase-2
VQRGFILQPTYRVESGRPVVWLYGKLESGGTFLVRDTRQVPRFWIREADVDAARDLGARYGEEAPPRVGMDGAPLRRVELARPQDTPPLRDLLQRKGIATYEADVRFAYRYLIDRGVRASVEIEGKSRPDRGIDAVFDDPELRPGDWIPALTVLSFDIETDPRISRLLSIAIAGCGVEEVLLLTPPGTACPPAAIACATEREMLERFAERVRALDPDVLTGWNVVDFDLAVFIRFAERAGVPLRLGRSDEPLRLRPLGVGRSANAAVVAGRLVLDGIALLRGAFVKLESYSLNSAAGAILGKSKTVSGSGRGTEILRMFEEDREALVEYNLQDARLVLEILDELKLVELSVERSRLTGLPPDRVGSSIAAFDFLYLSELQRRRVVAPTVRPEGGESWAQSGGEVLEPRPGIHRNVLVFDFKSLYPSLIRTFQIDPFGRLAAPTIDDDPILAPNGVAFRREPGILPGLLNDLFPRREAAVAAGDRVTGQAIKILMNSFYGVLGTPACRFASPELANAITGFGREILLWTKQRIVSRGIEVLYGDTDSLFVRSDLEDPDDARDLGRRLALELNEELDAHVRATWRVESRLELQFEQLYLRLLLPEVKHGSGGARKRYAGLIDSGEGTEVVFTGMEVVRRDWTELARRVQRELYERLFRDRPVESYVRQVVDDVRAGRLDDLLVYRKRLRRRLTSYVASTPPHVAAARKMSGKPGRVITYLITTAGPEPVEEQRAPIDHEHYVQKQVRSVAEPVLTLLGLDFDRVVGDDTQMRLF